MKNLKLLPLTPAQLKAQYEEGSYTTYYDMLDLKVMTRNYGTKHIKCYNMWYVNVFITKAKYTNLF